MAGRTSPTSGLHLVHDATDLLERGSRPCFSRPSPEPPRGRLRNDVFTFAQERLGIPHRTIRPTMLVEHLLAALETNEIRPRPAEVAAQCGRHPR